MTRFLDKLNLRPQERRLVIFVAVVVFVALNWFFVRPYFGELGRTQQRMGDAEKAMKRFNDEIQRRPAYIKQKEALSQQGALVPSGEQGTSLTREVNNQAVAAGVQVSSLTMAPAARDGRTNSFFEEQAANLSFGNTAEPELISFLYNLASQNSLIRVKSMFLHPEANRMKLGGTLTLVESFQKKTPAKGATALIPPKAASAPPKNTIVPPKTANLPKTNSPPKTVSSPSSGSKTNSPKKAITPPPGPK